MHSVEPNALPPSLVRVLFSCALSKWFLWNMSVVLSYCLCVCKHVNWNAFGTDAFEQTGQFNRFSRKLKSYLVLHEWIEFGMVCEWVCVWHHIQFQATQFEVPLSTSCSTVCVALQNVSVWFNEHRDTPLLASIFAWVAHIIHTSF